MAILINKTSVSCKCFRSTVAKKVNECKSHENNIEGFVNLLNFIHVLNKNWLSMILFYANDFLHNQH